MHLKYILGIDVGGSKIAAGLVDKKFNVTKFSTIPTSQTDLLGQIQRLIVDYSGFDAIGLGMPGPVSENGMVKKLGNLKVWKPINLKQIMARKFKVPVNVVNDAKAFALAEATLGSGKEFETVVGVTLGTGIGSGLIRDKKIYVGANGSAGEFGQFEMPNGKSFEQEIKEAGPFKNATQAHRFLRSVLSFIVRSVDPQIIIVGGGWANLPGMQKELELNIKTLKKYPIKTKVTISKLKHAGIIGTVLPLLKK